PSNWRYVMPILRTAAVVQRTGLSRTTLWRLERADDFPSRIRLGVNSVGWNSDEIEAWIERRPRGATTLAATLEDRHSQRGIDI
ncbi:MAG: AlpA family phage regulatory protein, partial [Pseudolabrys sp.]